MVICEYTQPLQYVGAVYSEMPDGLLPPGFRAVETTHEFPFFVIECNAQNGVSFEYTSFVETNKRIRMLDQREPDNPYCTYLTIYCIKDELKPLQPGVDALQPLPHIYVSNEWLKRYYQQGEELLLELSGHE
jgi:hypothetical protein